jgi:hypothetical protein
MRRDERRTKERTMDISDSDDQAEVPAVEMRDTAQPTAPGGDAPPARSSRSRNTLIGIVGAVVIAVAAFVGLHVGGSSAKSTGAAAASSQNGGSGQLGGAAGFRGLNRGTITAINGSTITMKTSDGTSVTVKTTSATKTTAQVSSSLSKIAVGDHVVVTRSTSGSKVAATRVSDSGTASATNGFGGGFGGGAGGTPPTGNFPSGGAPPSGAPTGAPSGSSTGQRPGGFPTIGTVTGVNGSTFTIKTASGSTTTVTTSASTTYSATETSSLSALKVGDTISVQTGSRPTNGATQSTSITATSITEGNLGGGL